MIYQFPHALDVAAFLVGASLILVTLVLVLTVYTFWRTLGHTRQNGTRHPVRTSLTLVGREFNDRIG